jgi:hypothetical protein
MTKENELNNKRIQAVMQHERGMTEQKARTLVHRWELGRQAPSVKQVGRILRKVGLD